MEKNITSPKSKKSKNIRSHKKQKKKKLAQKQNNFVLDCLNQQKSSLKIYNTINDQFLNYFVIRVHPNLKKGHHKFNSVSKINKIQQKEHYNHNLFQQMIKKQKAKISTARNPHSRTHNLPKILSQKEEVEEKDELQEIKIEDLKHSIKYKEKEKQQPILEVKSRQDIEEKVQKE